MCRIWQVEKLLKNEWALRTEWISYSKKHVLTAAHAHAYTHTHTHTHSMQQLVTLVQHNTSMHHNALHSHNINHFMSWTLHGQQYKATLFRHLITVPWTCTGLTPAFTLMWCLSACTSNPQSLQNGPVIQHTYKQQAHSLTQTQIWCILECDAEYSCKDQQDFDGICPLYNQDSLLHWGVEAAGSSKILALATRLHFKEHTFVVRFQSVVIQMFELGPAICSSCVVLCARICTHTHTHTQCNQDMRNVLLAACTKLLKEVSSHSK